jgi:hypothetical protein
MLAANTTTQDHRIEPLHLTASAQLVVEEVSET